MNTEETLLTLHGIKPTANRIVIAKALKAERQPMSMVELERQIRTIDKSGIFRTLMLFKAHHLVHAIADEDRHVHFYCEECHLTFCLYGTPIPSVDIPSGFEMESINYMIKGLCPDCARKRALRQSTKA